MSSLVKSTFEQVQGFSTEEELKETALKCYPNISWEEYIIFKVGEQYYAVTMSSYNFEIVISKEYISCCYKPFKTNIYKTDDFESNFINHPGFNNGRKKWNDRIIRDYENRIIWDYYVNKIITETEMNILLEAKGLNIIRLGKNVKGREVTYNNTKILLLLLFCKQTRFKGVTYKSYWEIDE